MRASCRNLGEERIMEGDYGTPCHQHVHDFERRAFTCVVQILFVPDADNENMSALQCLSCSFAQRFSRFFDDMTRHGSVNFTSEFDESSIDIELACLPRKIKWIYGNAMAA